MKNTKKKIAATIIVAVSMIGPTLAVNSDKSNDLTEVKLTIETADDGITLDDSLKFTKAYVDFNYFEEVTAQAKEHRKDRLIDFNTFVDYSKDENTIILDTRSKRMYDKMHIKGAVHINFADFTQQYLAEMIPDQNTRILIYCNNNFKQEPLFIEPFASKVVLPDLSELGSLEDKPSLDKTLALNIPTFINLYGYNYRNVYELSELVSSNHPQLELEGTDVLAPLGN